MLGEAVRTGISNTLRPLGFSDAVVVGGAACGIRLDETGESKTLFPDPAVRTGCTTADVRAGDAWTFGSPVFPFFSTAGESTFVFRPPAPRLLDALFPVVGVDCPNSSNGMIAVRVSLLSAGESKNPAPVVFVGLVGVAVGCDGLRGISRTTAGRNRNHRTKGRKRKKEEGRKRSSVTN